MRHLLLPVAALVLWALPASAQTSVVDPTFLDLNLEQDEMTTVEVSWQFNPLCIRPFDVDVVASDPAALVQNLSGVLQNLCGGDTTSFDIKFTGTGVAQSFDLQFVDAEFGGVLDTIPTTIAPASAQGSIHGLKWRDDDGDGQRDPDEPGVPGVTVYLDLNDNGELDRTEPATVTMADLPETDFDESGRYWLEGLPPGAYLVREVVPPGFSQTFPSLPAGAHRVAVEPGGAIEGLDFGNEPLMAGSLHGSKWRDDDGDGRRDPDEPGLAGVTIYLDENRNGVFDPGEPSTTTIADVPETDFDETGRYWLSNLDAGAYVVREVVPDGFVQTFPGCGGSHEVRLVDGTAVDGLDFGNRPPPGPGSIHGRKWLDDDGDGRRDPDEPGLAGVTIFSDLNDNGVLDRGEPLAVSMRDAPETDFDETGLYWLEGLRPGRHLIREVVPDGFRQTFPVGGAHDVSLPDDSAIEDLDFGNQPVRPGSVHGRKWLDRNGDARRGDDEPGLAGVTIYLDLDEDGTLGAGEPRTVSMEDDPATDFDESGLYWLTTPEAGPVLVREVVPDGFLQTFPPDAHDVVVEDNERVEGLDFGNRLRRRCDVDFDGAVDLRDLLHILVSRHQRVDAGDPRDADGDGVVTGHDLRRCARECDNRRCR